MTGISSGAAISSIAFIHVCTGRHTLLHHQYNASTIFEGKTHMHSMLTLFKNVNCTERQSNASMKLLGQSM